MPDDLANLILETIDPAMLESLGFANKDDMEKILSGCNDADKLLILNRYRHIIAIANAQIKARRPEKIEAIPLSWWEHDFKKKPPTLKEFIEDPYYLGSTLMPSEDSEGMFPTWKKILLEDFDWGSYIHNLVITGSLGIGKCHRSGDKIMLYDGSHRNVEDVVVGDRLMGDDSTPRTVLSLARGQDNLFEIVPTKGAKFCVNHDHILCLVDSCHGGKIVEVSVRDYLAWPAYKQAQHKIYRVPVTFESKPVPVDPYWLGYWLGDGSSHSTAITTADSEIAAQHQAVAASWGLNCYPYKGESAGKAKTYAASTSEPGRNGCGHSGRNGNGLHNAMVALGVIGNKHVPNVYKFNSVAVRKKVLAGFVDADADHEINGCYCATLVSKVLAEDIASLARSLGYAATCKPKKRGIKSIGFSGWYWHVSISGAHDLPVLLERKRSQPRLQPKSVLRTGFKVVPVGRGNYYGFTITGNGRYLMWDCTVTHNTYVMVALLLYRLTICTLLKNPQMVFGLTKGSKIVYNILSVTKQAVNETAFGDARNFMSKSIYFIDECNFDPDSKYSNFRVELPGDVYLTAGSKGWHVLGRNVLGVALDEGNWRNEADPDTKAYELYNEVRIRIANRFMRAGKFLPAISILASSAKDESSFTEQVIKEIEKADDPVHQKVYRNAVYKIKRHVLRLSGNWFKVAYGLKTQEPYILTGTYDEQGKPKEGPDQHEAAPTGASTELVPVEYLPEFKRRTRTALQSIAGISTGGSNRFFASIVNIERCIELAEGEGVVNPCRKDSPKQLPISSEDNMNIWDYLDHNKFLTKVQSRIVPKRHPYAARFAHLDLAMTGMAGLAICHLVGNQRVDGVINRVTGDPYSEYRLIAEYDFILTITAGRAKPINLEKIQNFIIWLYMECGFRFGLVTADSFQSAMPLQMLKSRNVETELLSVDRDKKVYTAWRQAFEELRLRPYRQDMMIHEAENLVDIESEKKVDHPRNGSKDTSDAAAGAYYNAIESDEKSSINIDNTPSIHGNQGLTPQSIERPPIEIPLPMGYNKIRSFSSVVR